MKDSFYRKSALLILTNFTTSILGFIYSVTLSRKIGPEGIGLFSLISPISSLLLSILSGGLFLAVSKVISEYYAKRQVKNLHKTIKSTIIFNFVLSIIIIFTFLFLSRTISIHIIKDLRILSAFRFLLVSIIFMTLSNTYKGYFFGTSNILIPAFIDVLEKAFRIIILLIIFKYIPNNYIDTNITIAYIVFFIGELLSYILLLIYYRFDKKEHYCTIDNKEDDSIQLLFNVLVISVPLMIVELISSSFHTLTTLLLPRRLIVSGLSYNVALELIGRFMGMALSIITFPMVILFSLSSLLIPDLASSMAKDDIYTVKKRIIQVLVMAFLLGILVMIIGFLFGENLGRLIFKEKDLGSYVRFIAFCAPFIYLSQISRSILNGLGKQKMIFTYSVIFSFLQIIMLYILVAVPQINIYGVGITLYVTNMLILLCYFREIRRVLVFK